MTGEPSVHTKVPSTASSVSPIHPPPKLSLSVWLVSASKIETRCPPAAWASASASDQVIVCSVRSMRRPSTVAWSSETRA